MVSGHELKQSNKTDRAFPTFRFSIIDQYETFNGRVTSKKTKAPLASFLEAHKTLKLINIDKDW